MPNITPSGRLRAGAWMKVAVPLATNIVTPLASMASVPAIDDVFQRKIRGRGVVRAGKGITLVFLSEDMDDIIRIIKLQENSGVLFDGVNETVKHEIKKARKVDFLVCY